ncbi:MAG: transporter ATP-binding protein [Frankiales bacterium]|nr:transporter ATP-binding protein [Frankiales bacterium]
MTTTPLLDLTGIAVHFGAVKAVNDVSLTVPRGVVCGLIGPNGSGKTTLLGAVSRLVPVNAGRLQFDGVDLTRAAPDVASRAGIARTFQAMRLLGHLSVRENVMIGADFHTAPRSLLRSWLDVRRSRVSERDSRAVAEQALDRVGMLDHADAGPLELPYGMQRRVEIARALATRPKLLLLDEPVAGMNDAERREVSDIIRSLSEDGLTQVLVEHDLATIHRVCDLAYVLNFGKVIAHGTAREVIHVPAVREAYLGHASLVEGGPPVGVVEEVV